MSQTFQLIKGEFAFFFSFQLMFNSSVVSNRIFVTWDNNLGTRDLEEQPKVHVLSLHSHTQYFTEAWPRKSDWYEQRENWFSEVLSCLWGKHYLFWTLNLQEALTWHGIYLPELTWQLAGSWGMFRFPSAWAAAQESSVTELCLSKAVTEQIAAQKDDMYSHQQESEKGNSIAASLRDTYHLELSDNLWKHKIQSIKLKMNDGAKMPLSFARSELLYLMQFLTFIRASKRWWN